MNNSIKNLYKQKKSLYFSNARSEIINLLPNFSDKVLDIGCGDGATLDWIKCLGKCNKTFGIEISAEPFLISKTKIDYSLNINIENERNFFPGEKFDLILVLDVLEHLIDPWKFLEMIRSRLNEKGVLIVSIPNIRHYSIIENLVLLGKWEYAQSGILDSTHLRFFTKKSLIKLFVEKDFIIDNITKYPIDFKSKTKIFNNLSLGLFSDFLTQQYIFKLKI